MLLKNTKLGYRPKIKDDVRISHLLFIDDMKLFAETEKDLTKMLETAEKFNDTVGMKFNVDKCAIMKIHRGKVISDESRIAQIPTMTSDEQYKYLGIHENQSFPVESSIHRRIQKENNQASEYKSQWEKHDPCNQYICSTSSHILIWSCKME
ncbi:hypothetical protein M8J77_007391 [Diaphorina citri]|nr:hypothetical protein M8J77_007391 [Diaphorina citri]